MHMVIDCLLTNMDAFASKYASYLSRRPFFVFYHLVDSPPKEVVLAMVSLKAMFPAFALGLRMFPYVRTVLFRVPFYLTRNSGFRDFYFLSYTR